MKSPHAGPEGKDRFVLDNGLIRLDFDLRTSDTMYNYIWVRNPKTDRFERLYNFGCDVWVRERGKRDFANTVGVRLEPRASAGGEQASVALRYPSPLVVYRQFEKASNPEAIWNYPDLPDPLPEIVRVADGSLDVSYSLRRGEAAFETCAKHLGGVIESVTPILNAMWVDNDHVPGTMYVEDVGEFDWDRKAAVSRIETCDVRYAIFYNRDGSGVPYGVVVCGRQRQGIYPHAGNPDGEGVFKACSANQEFRPKSAPTGRYNDTNLSCPFREGRVTPTIRWVLFPELGWGQGGEGPALLERLRGAMEEKHLSWWEGATRQPSAEIFLRDWPMRRPPPTLWR